jgi:hypothetical protein
MPAAASSASTYDGGVGGKKAIFATTLDVTSLDDPAGRQQLTDPCVAWHRGQLRPRRPRGRRLVPPNALPQVFPVLTHTWSGRIWARTGCIEVGETGTAPSWLTLRSQIRSRHGLRRCRAHAPPHASPRTSSLLLPRVPPQVP